MLKIQFDELTIDMISESSAVFTGDNVLNNWKAKSVKNVDFGSLSGNNNRYINNKSLVVKQILHDNNKKLGSAFDHYE